MIEITGKKWLSLVLWISLLGVVGCGKKEEVLPEVKPADDKEVIIPVQVKKIVRTTFVEEGQYFGTAYPIKTAHLISLTGGLVHSLKVRDGQRVKAGQSLCNIEGKKYQLIYESALLDESINKKKYELAVEHKEEGSYSELQVNGAKKNYLMAQQASLEAKKNRNMAYCKSPIFGVVTQHYVEANQNIAPGSPTIEIVQTKKIKILVGVPENEIMGYVKGSQALVTIKTRNQKDSIVQGKIYSISGSVDKKNRTFTVEVHIENKKNGVRSGQTLNVLLSKEPRQEVVVIPSQVILSLEKGTAVMLAKKQGTQYIAVKSVIEKGPSSKTHSLIESGLSSDDLLIVSGQALVAEGSLVSIQNIPSESSDKEAVSAGEDK